MLIARSSVFIANALGIEAASFWSAAEKDIAESPTAEPERQRKELWISGILELWNWGISGFLEMGILGNVIISLHYSITSLLHHSITEKKVQQP